MIRKAVSDDIELIEASYNEHFKHEMEYGAFTIFKKEIYPTRKDACKVLRLDTGSQNVSALSLYRKLGFQVVATDFMKVGNAIEHSDHLFLEKTLVQ